MDQGFMRQSVKALRRVQTQLTQRQLVGFRQMPLTRGDREHIKRAASLNPSMDLVAGDAVEPSTGLFRAKPGPRPVNVARDRD
eukprot:6491796-Amphidinium_carterae.1